VPLPHVEVAGLIKFQPKQATSPLITQPFSTSIVAAVSLAEAGGVCRFVGLLQETQR